MTVNTAADAKEFLEEAEKCAISVCQRRIKLERRCSTRELIEARRPQFIADESELIFTQVRSSSGPMKLHQARCQQYYRIRSVKVRYSGSLIRFV